MICYIPFLIACDIRIGISCIDYPHTLPCRKHYANSSQNGWSAIKLYLLKAAETAMEFITSRSWLSGLVSPLFCVADAQFTDQPSCYTPQYAEIKSNHMENSWKRQWQLDHFLGEPHLFQAVNPGFMYNLSVISLDDFPAVALQN